jgi:class 3 adenylate cyclase
VRTLTFLFADLREYTAFVERHGDVAATTLIADYRRLVRGEVAKAKGAEVKTEGDSFYVVFEAASDAVRCAISVLREADRYSRDRPDRPMRVGVGIHAGEPQPHEGQYVGGAVIVAARLAQHAQAGELLVSDVVRGLLPKGTIPQIRERAELVLKGIEDAPRAFSVTWTPEEAMRRTAPRFVSVEAAAPLDRTMLCPRVIGRETELEGVLPYWGKAKATWYLGQLRAWAAERGIELTEAETAATP